MTVMRFCPLCGGVVRQQVPVDDNRLREVCSACAAVHYQNPRMVVGVIAVWQERILLCRRAIEPRYGYWTLPAGYLENGESTLDGALREAREEAGADILRPEPYCLFDLPHIHQVYFFYRGELNEGRAVAGSESLETCLFAAEAIPWAELAFPVVRRALEYFLADRSSGRFVFRAEGDAGAG